MLSPLPRQRRSLLRPSLTRRVRIPRHIYDPTERARSVSEFNQLPMLATDYGGSSLADALTRRVTSRSIYSIGCLSDRRLRQCGASSATLTCSAIPTRRVSEGRSAADLAPTRERVSGQSRHRESEELRGRGWMLRYDEGWSSRDLRSCASLTYWITVSSDSSFQIQRMLPRSAHQCSRREVACSFNLRLHQALMSFRTFLGSVFAAPITMCI